jgi:hypothetical protein
MRASAFASSRVISHPPLVIQSTRAKSVRFGLFASKPLIFRHLKALGKGEVHSSILCGSTIRSTLVSLGYSDTWLEITADLALVVDRLHPARNGVHKQNPAPTPVQNPCGLFGICSQVLSRSMPFEIFHVFPMTLFNLCVM